MIEIPVTMGFDSDKVIGKLMVDETMLPAEPDFVFSLAVTSAMSFGLDDKGVKTNGPFKLVEVSLISDDNYIGYLRQSGKIPTEEQNPID
jgi:hypothetical protein